MHYQFIHLSQNATPLTMHITPTTSPTIHSCPITSPRMHYSPNTCPIMQHSHNNMSVLVYDVLQGLWFDVIVITVWIIVVTEMQVFREVWDLGAQRLFVMCFLYRRLEEWKMKGAEQQPRKQQ